MDDPKLPRDRDSGETTKYLGDNIWLATGLIVILFVISQSWSEVYSRAVVSFLGREPSLLEETFIALVVTVAFILFLKYVLKITLISFS